MDFDFPLTLETLDKAPDEFKALYEEKDGKFQMLAVLAKKTTDLGNLKKALDDERKKARTLEEFKSGWGDLTPDAVKPKLEELQTLQDKIASGEIKPHDNEKIEEIIGQRLDRIQKGHEREIERVRSEVTKKDGQIKSLDDLLKRKTLEQSLRTAAVDSGVERHSVEDAVANAGRIFEPDVEYNPKPREGSGYGADYTPVRYFKEIKEAGEKPGWFFNPKTQGSDTQPGGSPNSGVKGKVMRREEFDKLSPEKKIFEAGRAAKGEITIVDAA